MCRNRIQKASSEIVQQFWASFSHYVVSFNYYFDWNTHLSLTRIKR